MKKTCFVIMGFGKKMDPHNSVLVDLDKIYTEIIKPLFEKELASYTLIRADEIAGSALIDSSMYSLLMNAELVIADITTLNPNAIYELGIRHAVRPYSTIMMSQESCKIPFDLDHSRCLKYSDINEQIDEFELRKTQNKLKSFILASEKNEVDSPLHSFFPGVIVSDTNRKEYELLVEQIENKTDTISSFMDTAITAMNQSDFDTAIRVWEKLRKLLPNNEYIVQQMALATYKSESPSKTKSLEKALVILRELNLEKSLDLETIGMAGGIYKRLFRINNNFDYLDEAIKYYQKGFIIKNDYYNGENYANCTLLKTQSRHLTSEDKENLKYNSKKLYEKIIDIIHESLVDNEEDFWMYATLSVCYYGLKNENKFQEYQRMFYDKCDAEWQKKSYMETIEELKPCIDFAHKR